MSLVINQQPGAIVLSKNPVVYKLLALNDSAELFGPKGARAWMQFDVAGMPNDNTVTLEWTETSGVSSSLTFTAKTVPAGITEIPADHTAYGSFDLYIEAVAEAIGAHPLIAPFFFVYADAATDRVYVQAKDTSTEFDVAFTGTPGPDISLDNEEAWQNTIPVGYAIIMDVFVERVYGSGEYIHSASLEAVPNADSEAWFDLSSVLHKEGLLGLPDPPLPVWDSATPYLAPTLRNYYVRISELTGLAVNVQVLDIKQFYLGGIAQNLFAEYDFFATLNNANSLITWTPDGKEVAPGQNEWLAWYNYGETAALAKIELTIISPAGSTDTNYVYQNNGVSVPPGGILLFPVGLQVMLDAISVTNDTVVKYTVRVVTNDSTPEANTYLSQPRSYYIDRRYYEDVRYLQYLSGFYLPETLRCTGIFGTELEVDREESQRVLTPDYASTTTEQFQHAQDWRNYFRYHTGYMRRFDLDALQELLIYGRAYEVYAQGYIPLLLKGKSFPIHETTQNLYSAQIQAEPALRQINYSNLNIPLDTDAAEEGWLLVAGDYWRTVFGQIWKLV